MILLCSYWLRAFSHGFFIMMQPMETTEHLLGNMPRVFSNLIARVSLTPCKHHWECLQYSLNFPQRSTVLSRMFPKALDTFLVCLGKKWGHVPYISLETAGFCTCLWIHNQRRNWQIKNPSQVLCLILPVQSHHIANLKLLQKLLWNPHWQQSPPPPPTAVPD
jgi:hypothetical protein